MRHLHVTNCLNIVFIVSALLTVNCEPVAKRTSTLAGQSKTFLEKFRQAKVDAANYPPNESTKKPVTVTKYLGFNGDFDIDPEKHTLTMTISTCEQWIDSRLEWEKDSSNVDHLLVSWFHTWYPDTLFLTEYKVLFRFPSSVERDGTVTACDSLRLTVPCSFDFRHFPDDVNICSFQAHSFSYGSERLVYRIALSALKANAEWEIKTSSHVADQLHPIQGNVSTVFIELHISRKPHLYGARVYLPLWSVIMLSIVATHAHEESQIVISSTVLMLAAVQHGHLLTLVTGSTATSKIVMFSGAVVINSFFILVVAAFRSRLQETDPSDKDASAKPSSRWIEKVTFQAVGALLACVLLFL